MTPRWRLAAQNALALLRGERFSPAHATPYDVVWQDRGYALRRFQSDAAADARPAPAILLVPSQFIAGEMFDLGPGQSAVAALLGRGLDVWMFDFGDPEQLDGGMDRTLDDVVVGLSDAIDQMRQHVTDDLHVVAYSQGGMVAYEAAAYRGCEGIRSLVTLGTSVDLHKNNWFGGDRVGPALVRLWARFHRRRLRQTRGVSGRTVARWYRAITLHKEVSFFFGQLRHLHDREALARRQRSRIFLSGSGFMACPGPTLRQFVDDIVVANRMMSPGYVVGGRPVSLSDVTCPILVVRGERDVVGLERAVAGIRQAAPKAEISEIVLPSGHFGLAVGARAMRTTWPAVDEWTRWREGGGDPPARFRGSA